MYSVTVKTASEGWFSELFNLCPIYEACGALTFASARLSCRVSKKCYYYSRDKIVSGVGTKIVPQIYTGEFSRCLGAVGAYDIDIHATIVGCLIHDLLFLPISTIESRVG